ncbi:hypothetical protein COW36_02005 [bacterium (Candidatus Blackallbacteria) CG17_big_fil_post_rev_8_21_14_2_50_48_46]|uniref:Uncharacterized protein n=1 Tax=bacterium (Candidatus Blackallbacteria) CG17_big_fil_post_rev_8_21_14_2_50_48_46 TaxID=2014261 RepID=A0A2M7GB99_9BACT|nr:MAG: hypothetical protein COW64_26395 [bacterium (Candidatus Blackallbacteria) CG18_big_fil_WC_8_21_14_2_50_49_26]PIW19208.1 MAG: hypothetical protein COW36_02005 [bacterium (Candidatus Blackallbacteria) CG17_big_fil_post_rev_8_21_14_2_50_48_46]PIW45442.1 MAG: hypothetical protein COW20_20135 [bacterium (Candidatus Blackallbacteria) CG13_big_fil_rev_8_21_14_2_50_49_14]
MQIKRPEGISGQGIATIARPAQKCTQEINSLDQPSQVAKCIDSHISSSIGGKIEAPSFGFFHQDAKALVNETLSEMRNNNPMASKFALHEFSAELRSMTPGELDDVKDVIVAKMASPKSSQSDRDALMKMYKLADAASENRLSPSRPMPKPFPIDPGFEYPMPQPAHPNRRFKDTVIPFSDLAQAAN